MAISFVEDLDIASDHRLRSHNLVETHEITGVKRDEAGRAPDETHALPPVGDNLRAAVNAGSVVSFVAGVKA
ncbi:hypothetical protein ACWTQZ_26865, partial [Escherichia coli]